ncbi:beta-N-acetylhexosaminidase [Agromyces soli]
MRVTARRTRARRVVVLALTLALAAPLAACAPNPKGADVPALIPSPAELELTGDAPFRLSERSRIVVDGDAGTAPGLLAERLRAATGFQLPVAETAEAEASDIEIVVAPGEHDAEEGYTLATGPEGARIGASAAAGAFWGTQTLLQLLPPEAHRGALDGAAADAPEGSSVEPEGGWVAPAARIDDAPRFAYRGAMLDVARHFLPVGDVLRYVDEIAMLKLNMLHLHLTDDQGWRLQIDAWPELTGIGASTSTGGDGGGFYTKDDYRRIVEYAAARHITIVPEIDLPGHTNAALSAYPELNCDGVAPAPYEGIEVGFSSLCASPERREATDRFLADVTREVAELTPGPWIHLGGDESLATSESDYLDLVARITAAGAATGKTVIGWHEMGASTALPTGTVGQYWDFVAPRLDTGAADDTRSFVAQGGRIVFSPADVAYLDMKYVDDPQNALGHRLGQEWAQGPTTIEEAYGWDPAAIVDGIGDDDILGVEAPIWTETLRTIEDVEFMAFPRILPIAEIAWSPAAPEGRDEAGFIARVGAFGARLDAMGVGFYRVRGVDWA